MDNHGGRTSLPRAHRPRAPVMSAPAPLTAPLTPLRPPPPVTLTAPRPEADRSTNEYVETPIRGGCGGNAGIAVTPPPPPSPPSLHGSTTVVGSLFLPHQQPPHQIPPPQPPRAIRPTRLPLPPPPPPVTKQPVTNTNAPNKDSTTTNAGAALECAARPSILCPECEKCRCDSCQQPRPLPSRWICDNQCLCSAEAVIDYASCLCCVKALFYHCSESDSGGAASCADDPCGCGPHKRLARWGCLAALSWVLPCLWCYWPLQCCKRAVETCYARHSRRGCRCRPPLATPEKRLLDSTSDF
ncbi:protein sprouty [Agrilus planipennis]|uniref:Protein sprouty n=1 Tax=Agrilus planipennis TaxID=224129 RepID=A0A1W4XJR2_AGRPL|nr:protein sprouty [Agrilus planipennis]XP_018336220.1 protein sprouty [Agrilus planipennis]XP_018336221.1 protein sprouty [Agrilus planipennis]